MSNLKSVGVLIQNFWTYSSESKKEFLEFFSLHSAGRHYILSIFTAIVLETLCEFAPGSKLVNI